MKNNIVKIIAVIVTFFGLLTIIAGGGVIFDMFGMRAKEGNYVLFVVWANFICGFLYLLAAYGLFKRKTWTSKVLGIAVALLLVTFLGLLIWILNGNIYERKTIVAMTFRTLFTIALFILAINRRNKILIDSAT